jgi:hypothetical protein
MELKDYEIENRLDGETDDKASMKQLKNSLKASLKTSGALDTIRSQIRREFINGLSITKNPSPQIDIRDRVLYSVVFHMMRTRRFKNSISVFTTECGLNSLESLISEQDILRMMKHNAIISMYTALNNNKENDGASTSVVDRGSILDVLLQFSLILSGENSNEISTQTDATGPGARELLDAQVAELRRLYSTSRDAERLMPSKTIEERMIAFSRDCESRMSKDMNMQIMHFRENELAKVKLEEAQKSRLALEALRREYDQEYNRRLQVHLDREAACDKLVADKERSMQQSQYESRQLLQREIDDLRSREQISLRKYEMESHGLRLLEMRLKEAESVLETREHDLSKREKLLEQKIVDCGVAARKEAAAKFQAELDLMAVDRTSLIGERKRFEDEKAVHAASLAGAASLRTQLNTALQTVIIKEEEVESLRRLQERMALQRKEEEKQITDVSGVIIVIQNITVANGLPTRLFLSRC